GLERPHAARRAPPPGVRPRGARRHPRAARGVGVRYTQVKRLATVEALRAHLDELGVQLPLDDEVDPAGVLAEPLEVRDGSAGVLRVPNRFAVLPMEGWDGTPDGRPTD